MRYSDYLRKAKIMLKEAEEDLNIGCYNKAVSASWFAVESLLRAIVLKKRKPMPERPNKLISLIHRLLYTEHPDKKHLAHIISSLYEKRKRADHRETLFNRIHAMKSLSQAESIYNELINILI